MFFHLLAYSPNTQRAFFVFKICTFFFLGQFLISFRLSRDNIHLKPSDLVKTALFQCFLNFLCVLREYAKKNFIEVGECVKSVHGDYIWRF